MFDAGLGSEAWVSAALAVVILILVSASPVHARDQTAAEADTGSKFPHGFVSGCSRIARR